MILVDSSVWIDYFQGVATTQTEKFDRLLRERKVATGDLILAEVLQGFRDEREFRAARNVMTEITVIEIGGREVAVSAARNYRALRRLGMTVRGTIDTLIATRCLIDGHELLHDDRDFDPFAQHLGLRVI